MALPKVAVPTYSLKLPSDGRTLEFRPFLVKEEKILLLGIKQASEMMEMSKAQSHLIKTFKTILKECILTKGYDLDDAPVFDLEYIFINIRAKSVGEIVEPTYTCECGTPVEVRVNLTEIEVNKLIKNSAKSNKYLANTKIVKTIFVKNKIINYILNS